MTQTIVIEMQADIVEERPHISTNLGAHCLMQQHANTKTKLQLKSVEFKNEAQRRMLRRSCKPVRLFLFNTLKFVMQPGLCCRESNLVLL